MPRITLTRKKAAIKLESAVRARYYFERAGGDRHEKDWPVEDVRKTFAGDHKVLMRIELDSSRHFVTLVDRKDLKIGYEVWF